MRDMDENLMPVSNLWDPEVQEAVRSKIAHFKRSGKKIDKEGYLQDIEGAYHAIGGFARLAHTANEDPKWFYTRFGERLLPDIKGEMDVNINILPALPRSPLDGEYTDVEVSTAPPTLDSSAGPDSNDLSRPGLGGSNVEYGRFDD